MQTSFTDDTRLLDGKALRSLSDEEYERARLAIRRALVAEIGAGSGPGRLIDLSAHHSEWQVRALAVELLAEHFIADPAARRAIADATHDATDGVAFTAIQRSGAHQISEAVRELIRISGWPSKFTRPDFNRKPVGRGAAYTKRALVEILGSTDAEELRRLEDEHFAPLRAEVAARRRPPDLSDAVYVPAGPFIAGCEPLASDPFRMDTSDNPRRTVDLPAFSIDRTAVTNARYRRYLEESAGGSGELDHPDQPEGKSHVPAHWRDPRFNAPDLPVVGIDWYDAWAFARWAGGELPSEDQWEKAARGTDGRTFPWGDEWDPARANYVERAYGVPVSGLEELEALLRGTTAEHPRTPVLPASSCPEGASPYGLLHMSGNVWEMTRTNFYTRDDMDPFFRGRAIVDFMNRREGFHVLRGGTWTSPPVCLTTFYRGKDLLTDRHDEVGFRCVYPAPD